MALFYESKGGQPPILTQLYQLDPDNPTELEAWYDRKNQIPELQLRDTITLKDLEIRKEQISDLESLVRLTRNLMNSILDHRAVFNRDLGELNYFTQKYPPWTIYSGGNNFIGNPDDELIPLAALDTHQWARQVPALCVKMLELLINLHIQNSSIKQKYAHRDDLPKDIFLKRCAECGNVFFLVRQQQEYCSDRCSSTARWRKRKTLNTNADNSVIGVGGV